MEDKFSYTWDELFERAIDRPFLSPELKAKDNARFLLSVLILEEEGYDIEECECLEDEIEAFLAKRKEPLLFDENGNFINLRKE